MLATTENVWALFTTKRFQIPLYQRHYDWQEEQCQALWEDLTRLCEAPDSSHYLGTMVVELLSDRGVYQIVDGQQRTTSLMLLLKALHDRSSEEDRAKLRVLIYFGPAHAGEESSLRLTPQHTDLANFRAVMEGSQPVATNPRFEQNYELFSQFVQAQPLTIERVESALGRMHLAFIELDRQGADRDDPQTIFEKMNAEGKNLETHDLIRNYVFLLAAESGNADAVEPERAASASSKQRSLYLNEWQNFESEFPDRAFSQLKHFFRDYLVIKTGDPQPSSGRELYGKFKRYVQSISAAASSSGVPASLRFKAVERIANDIWRYASAWTKVAFGKELRGEWEERDKLQKQIKDFSLIGHDPYYPLATLLLRHGQDKKELHRNLATVLEMLNKFLAVSELTDTPIDFRRKLLDPFIGSSEHEESLQEFLRNPAAFKAKLLELWPAGFDPTTRLKQALLGGPFREVGLEQEAAGGALELGSETQTHEVSETTDGTDDALHIPSASTGAAQEHGTPPDVYRRATTYLLLRINERIMQAEKDTPVGYLEPDFSLEHIMPQTVDNAEGWSDVPREFHQSQLHSLGNLTVVGRGFNSRIRNRPLAEKVRYYAMSSYGLTRQLAREIELADLYRDAATGKLNWNKLGQFLRTRAEALAKDAVEVLRF